MTELKTYIKESFQNNRNTRWNKSSILVFLTEITHPEYKNQQKEYYDLVKKGLNHWNKIIGDKVKFVLTTNKLEADIIVRFNRVSIVYWGMCCYDVVSNSEFKKMTVKLGLSNEYNGAKLTPNDKFVLVLHEFGHALGLGHSTRKDIMTSSYYPQKEWVSLNDIVTLKILYDLPVGIYYNEAQKEIEKLEEKYKELYCNKETTPTYKSSRKQEKQDIPETLEDIANLNLYKMSILDNVKLPSDCQKLLNNEQVKNYKNQNED